MPQVTILEGGKPKSFAGVDKLQIALSGGGTSLWVPKDTRLLTALTANVNGTYPPPEGYFGFDTVIVDVPPSQVAGIDPETGQYVLVGTKKTESEDPKWPTDPTEPDDPWDPDTDGGNGWDPWEVPGGGEWEPPSEWPTTENELTQERIPSGIKIVKNPDKTTYKAGEAMDYTGIRVQLLDENGQPFASERYANTFIPFSELLFPVTTAPEKSTVGTTYWQGTDTSSMEGEAYWFEPYGTWPNYWYRCNYSGGCRLVYVNDRLFLVSDSGFPFDTGGTYFGWSNYWSGGAGGGQGVMVGDYWVIKDGFNNVRTSHVPTVEMIEGATEHETALAYTYGERSIGGNMIPVQWKSPYDGIIYEDKFPVTITVTASDDNTSDPEGGGGGFSGGGGEGTGGGGGGGGF